VTRAAGLESSVGKTYFSNSFAVINSSHFDFKPEKGWVERKYVNMGLVLGVDRSSASARDKDKDYRLVSGLGPKHRELKRACPAELWDAVNQLFHYYNMDLLKTYKGPWYLPEWLGGLGLVPNEDTFTPEILRAAAYMKCNLIGTKEGPQPWPKEKEWYMHEIVQERYSELFPLAGNKCYDQICLHLEGEENGTTWTKMEEANNHVYKMITIESLFGSNFESLMRKPPKGKGSRKGQGKFRTPKEQEKRIMTHNGRAWAKAMNENFKNKTLVPMTIKDFNFKPRPALLPLL
jgi:hypothetical protein